MTTPSLLRAGGLARALGVVLLSAFGASAQAGGNPDDPFEGFNRQMFAVHEVVDTYVARPVAQAYDATVPLPVKMGVGNFFDNIGTPWVGVNNLLQGKPANAGNDALRFLVNTTVGIFGLFDVASEMGMPKHDEDLGQTLGVWGVGSGGYVFLPLVGPKTVRDTASWVVDFRESPTSRVEPDDVRYGLTALRVVDVRAGLLPADRVLEEAALDKYAYLRDAYLQRRHNLIHDGRPPMEDFDVYDD